MVPNDMAQAFDKGEEDKKERRYSKIKVNNIYSKLKLMQQSPALLSNCQQQEVAIPDSSPLLLVIRSIACFCHLIPKTKHPLVVIFILSKQSTSVVD